MTQTLNHKTILITGATSGIGKSIATASAKSGANLILMGRSLKKLETLQQEISLSVNQKIAIYPMDFASSLPEQYGDLKSFIDEKFGVLDTVIWSARQKFTFTPIENYSIKHWHSIIQTNVNAPFMLIQSLLPLLKQQASTILFNVGQSTDVNAPYCGAHGTSQAALKTLMQILHTELQTNTKIKVVGVDPVRVKTAQTISLFPGGDCRAYHLPENIAPFYLKLLTGEHVFKNGQILTLTPKQEEVEHAD